MPLITFFLGKKISLLFLSITFCLSILNLNKGKVYSEISNIYKNIEESKDEKLLDYLAPSNEISGLDKLKSIEKVLEFLISFKEIQKKKQQ